MKVHRFKLSGGEAITLNDAQLYALHHMPAQYVSWPTYWALRRRKLITGPQHYIRTDLTERGKEVVAIDRPLQPQRNLQHIQTPRHPVAGSAYYWDSTC